MNALGQRPDVFVFGTLDPAVIDFFRQTRLHGQSVDEMDSLIEIRLAEGSFTASRASRRSSHGHPPPPAAHVLNRKAQSSRQLRLALLAWSMP